MHERTQRALARFVFVVCCAVPTIFTLVILLVTWTPWYHQAELRELTESIAKDTGFLIEVADFERPSPSRLELVGVRVIDPETQHEVAWVDRLSWTEVNDGVSIVLSHPKLSAAELSGAWRLVHDRFLCSSLCLSTPVRFAASDLEIERVNGDRAAGLNSLQDIDAWIEPGQGSTRATIECVRSSQRAGSGFRIEVVRDRTTDTPTTQWLLETRDAALPCSALSDYLTPLRSLGPNAAFAGRIRWSIDTNGWWVDLGTSRFTGVDLASISERSPHRLSGTATLSLTRGMIRPGKTLDVLGELRATQGFVSTSLLASLETDFGMSVTGDFRNRQTMPYDYLGVQFEFSGSALTLDGICRTEETLKSLPAGVVFCAGNSPLVEARELQMAAVNLTRAFTTPESVTVPLSELTMPIIEWLVPPSPVSRIGALPTSSAPRRDGW
ncbi:hypothetical protein [Novipirellula artificiosorum]|uniref:AsmA-like C-terminal domain-containing protein n=1 Tax=Novipirellula artificiosorum TaxID=2528016 RepID=A0A5C6E4C9_9BACT|nr:hypothetical protein [Novipirellula artificiosorum]TWU42286.1 hypothetical protein Poly41_05820 [Novipirellula artificiosorum]